MRRLTRILAIVSLAGNCVLAQNINNGEIVPGDNLVVDGITKIPSSIAQAVARYRNSYGYPIAGWDPNKGEVWLKILASTGTWISRIETPDSIAKPMITIPAAGAYDVYFQPQGKYLVYNKDTSGDENFQFYLYDIATRGSKLLTDGKS